MTDSPLDPRLIALINPELLFAEPERFSDMGFWHEHIPFAFVLMDLLAPRNFVELGAHKGDSYFAFCQAVTRLGLPTRCYAVDSWRGDVHTSEYADTVFAEFKAWHDPRYAAFSAPMRMTFDDASSKFEDGSIDLLHIDGTHTYDAVKHDFETWKPKLSERGVVLFHDVNVRRDDFGVWKFWSEISAGRAHFEFLHGNGLGVLATGTSIPGKFLEFMDLAKTMPNAVRALFEAFGQRVARGAVESKQISRIAALEKTQGELFLNLDRVNRELESLGQAHTALIGQRDAQDIRLAAMSGEIAIVQNELARAKGELSAVYESNSWKITSPVRKLARLLRRG